MSAEDWLPPWDFDSDHDGPQPDECKLCKCEIWWEDRVPYDDQDCERRHNCPARVAEADDFPLMEES